MAERKTAYNKIGKKKLPDSVELAGKEENAARQEAPKTKKARVIILNGLNVRKGPSKNDEVIRVLKHGALIAISEIKTVGDEKWAKLADGSGYIMAKGNYILIEP